MPDLVRALPQPHMLRGLQNQAWTVGGAISELVDNGFGEGRGNAQNIWVTWNATERVLTVLDDGDGMDDVSRLYRLGDTIGVRPGDIGKYGMGGTLALLWLGRRAQVWTLKDGRVASATVNWDQQITDNEFPEIDRSTYRVTPANTPTELLAVHHGTLVRLEFPPKRHMTVPNVQRELALRYGPAMRRGRRLFWLTVGRGSWGEQKSLAEVIRIPNPTTLMVEFELDGHTLGAVGEAGIVPGLRIADSEVGIGFGTRLLFTTKDCYRSPDGSRTYGGIGVCGYVDLQENWLGFLTQLKSNIDDDRARSMLMAALFAQLEPLLKEAEERNLSVLLENIMFELQTSGIVALNRRDSGGLLRPDPEGDEVMPVVQRGDGLERERNPHTPASAQDPEAMKFELARATDHDMEGLLCKVDSIAGGLKGYINIEHPFVTAAIQMDPPNRMALHELVAHSIADLLFEREDLLKKVLSKAVLRQIEEREEPRVRRGYLARLMVDRIRTAVT